jgi:hypothetical protein
MIRAPHCVPAASRRAELADRKLPARRDLIYGATFNSVSGTVWCLENPHPKQTVILSESGK